MQRGGVGVRGAERKRGGQLPMGGRGAEQQSYDLLYRFRTGLLDPGGEQHLGRLRPCGERDGVGP
jgi:hypothetical protein